MKHVLITGGTGNLGQALVPLLKRDGHTVRIMSRRLPNSGEDADLEWARASLESDDGLAEAVAGVDVIIHAASNPTKSQVDVDGTGHLLRHAREAGVGHFVYISIVGIDQISFAYYQNKLAAEKLIENGGVPWSILRATQFHEFIDRIIGALTRFPIAFVPTNWQFQPISTREVAEHLVTAVRQGAAGHLTDIGGPEVLRLGDMARQWLAAQGKRRLMIHLPVPGGLSTGFKKGLNTTPQHRAGQMTWAEWLAWRYGNEMVNEAVPDGVGKERLST
jgi:uncharacterized protein YbjT (DUF2867 family)